MSRVAIEKVKGSGTEPLWLIAKLESTAQRVRERAYEIFQTRGTDGRALDDWLEAERQLIFAPEPEVSEKDGKYEIRAVLPGFKANETNVIVLPDAVLISAKSSLKHQETTGTISIEESASKMLYRRVDFSTPIDVDKVAASLDDGTLRITAPKIQAARTAHAA